MKTAAMNPKPKIALGVIALIASVFAVFLVVYDGQMGVAESPRPVLRPHHLVAGPGPAASIPVATATSTTESTVLMSGDVLSNEELMHSSGTLSV